MVDYTAFLETILEWPDDDAPRLVLADYLDEQGRHERARFIRLQCMQAVMDPATPAYAEARREERDLLAARMVEWWGELPRHFGVEWEGFERGFVSTVRFKGLDAFRRHAREVFDAAPVLNVRFSDLDAAEAAETARSPLLRNLLGLDFENNCRLGNAGAEAVGNCPHLERLRSLNLRSNRLGPSGVRSIADSPHLRCLEDLNLDWNDIYEDGADALRCETRPKPFRRLSLGWTRVGDAGVRRLCGSGSIGGIQWLYLTSNGLTDAAAAEIAECAAFGNLQALYADQNGIGDRGAEALAASPALAGLRWLYLRHNRIGDGGGRALAESPNLERIEELQLAENQVNDPAVRSALQARFGDRVRV